MISMNRQILHIDLDAFFISVERLLDPALQNVPAVVGGHPDGRGVVSCASYEARAFGIRSAMPVATAIRLCPTLVILSGNYSSYVEYSTKFHAILADFSPDLEPMGIDEAYVDITGFEPLYGPISETAQRIKQRIFNEIGLKASVGIATSKLVAKVGSDYCKPDGLIEISPGEERGFLAPLPVEKLPGVGKKMQLVFKQMNTRTVGQLASLPVSFLKQRFGTYGQALHDHANGIDDSEVQSRGEAKSISREITLEQDTMDRKLLKANLRYLAERVGADLRSQEKQARCVSLKLRYTDFDTISRSRTYKTAVDSDRYIFNAAEELFDKALSQRYDLVRLLGVKVSSLTAEARQLNMLNDEDEKMAHLNLAVDQIRKKYGFKFIETGRTLLLKDKYRRGKASKSF